MFYSSVYIVQIYHLCQMNASDKSYIMMVGKRTVIDTRYFCIGNLFIGIHISDPKFHIINTN